MKRSNKPLFVVEDVDAVRIADPNDIRRAAEEPSTGSRWILRKCASLPPTTSPTSARPSMSPARSWLRTYSAGRAKTSCGGRTRESHLIRRSHRPGRFESEPFWVNAQGFRTRLPNTYLDAIDLSNFDARAMTWAAIVVPVHLPFGQIGAVSFNPIDRERTDLSEEYLKFGDFFGLCGRTFISSYVTAMGALQRLPPRSHLSKCEVECLRWAAIGKTDFEISMIMSRSRATVRFHIHNAAVKLDAVNRSHTVFKAAQLGYISLG
jgi:LuxR family quorum-sensing system transcriptional regulator CciR